MVTPRFLLASSTKNYETRHESRRRRFLPYNRMDTKSTKLTRRYDNSFLLMAETLTTAKNIPAYYIFFSKDYTCQWEAKTRNWKKYVYWIPNYLFTDKKKTFMLYCDVSCALPGLFSVKRAIGRDFGTILPRKLCSFVHKIHTV